MRGTLLHPAQRLPQRFHVEEVCGPEMRVAINNRGVDALGVDVDGNAGSGQVVEVQVQLTAPGREPAAYFGEDHVTDREVDG